MRKLFFFAAIVAAAIVCRGQAPDNLVLVKGGTFKNTKSNYYGRGITISSFYMGTAHRHELGTRRASVKALVS